MKEIAGKSLQEWLNKYPILKDILELKPVLWFNPQLGKTDQVLPTVPFTLQDMMDAEKRWYRFAPLIQKLFPNTTNKSGIIESKFTKIPNMKKFLETFFNSEIKGEVYLKWDHDLPIAGSIKARGGIYEVLKHAEDLVLREGIMTMEEDYSVLAEDRFKKFFHRYHLAVGSTGNLGLSIGIMGAALGFRVTVHMSADAKEWKKKRLRDRGVEVIEYQTDYSKAVEEGRRQSMADPMSYFIDDENSKDLFLGYSVAAFRLKEQLDEKNIPVDEEHPLMVYLPCGVGGAPGGICFGLKNLFGDHVHCYFVEPTHSPCMLLGLVTGKHDEIHVGDFGIDNITEADGLAVGRPSRLAGKIIEKLIHGVYTIEDHDLYRLLALLQDSEGIQVEPSAAAGLLGPINLSKKEINTATHLVWTTGGAFVPKEIMEGFYQKGKKGIQNK